MNRQTVHRTGVLSLLFLMGLSVPWALQAVFPPVKARTETPLGEEKPILPKPEWTNPQEKVAWLTTRRAEDEAWLNGQERDSDQEGVLDDRPSVFASYDRYWDSFKLVQERWRVGTGLFLFPHTYVEASVHELLFHDPFQTVKGRGGALELAHQWTERLVLQESLEVHHYEGLHDSVNGSVQANVQATEKLFVNLGARWEDVWERIAAITNRVRLFTVGPYVYYEFLPGWWLAGEYLYGHYTAQNTRDNSRQFVMGELGYFLWKKLGLSLSGGVESYHFDHEAPFYWSPDHYRLLYGRIRMERGFEEPLFAQRLEKRLTLWNRLGYLLEYRVGLSNTDDVEHLVRAGLSYHLTERWNVRVEASRLDSNGRFDSHYSENKVEGKITYKF